MKKWIISLLVLGFLLPNLNVNAEEPVEEVELVSITLEEGAFPGNEEVESVLNYIDEHLSQAFETFYTDWESESEAVYIFLFSEAITEEHLAEMHDLAGDVSVAFEEIEYTRAELEAKQTEIVDAGFEYDDFSIHQVGPDMIEGYVTIGIEPYNEENAQFLYAQFGDELVLVEEGYEMSTLEIARTDDKEEEMQTISFDEEGVDEEAEEEQEDDLNWFQRIWHTITSWWPF